MFDRAEDEAKALKDKTAMSAELEAKLSERGFWTVVLLRTFTFLLQPADRVGPRDPGDLDQVLSGTEAA